MTLGKPGCGQRRGLLQRCKQRRGCAQWRHFCRRRPWWNTNDRVVEFDKTGKQIATWGKHGKGQGEFDQLHGIAMDSQGGFSWPTAATAASRSSIRTENSSLNGSSSAGRAMSPSTKTT